MCKITYLNCTLTVSSNKHIGLLEEKKEALSEPAIAFIPPLFWMKQQRRSYFYLKHWKYI